MTRSPLNAPPRAVAARDQHENIRCRGAGNHVRVLADDGLELDRSGIRARVAPSPDEFVARGVPFHRYRKHPRLEPGEGVGSALKRQDAWPHEQLERHERRDRVPG